MLSPGMSMTSQYAMAVFLSFTYDIFSSFGCECSETDAYYVKSNTVYLSKKKLQSCIYSPNDHCQL